MHVKCKRSPFVELDHNKENWNNSYTTRLYERHWQHIWSMYITVSYEKLRFLAPLSSPICVTCIALAIQWPFILTTYTTQSVHCTVKPVLGRHPRDLCSCLLNTGCPLKTGSLRIHLKRVILIFVSIKRPWKGQIAFSWTVKNSEIPYFHKQFSTSIWG